MPPITILQILHNDKRLTRHTIPPSGQPGVLAEVLLPREVGRLIRMTGTRARAVTNPDQSISIHELAGFRNIALEAALFGIEEIDLCKAESPNSLDGHFPSREVALGERLGPAVRSLEVRTHIATIRIEQLDVFTTHRLMHQNDVDDAA